MEPEKPNAFLLFQNIKLISILVQQGKLQEEELESVLKFLFPTKYVNSIIITFLLFLVYPYAIERFHLC